MTNMLNVFYQLESSIEKLEAINITLHSDDLTGVIITLDDCKDNFTIAEKPSYQVEQITQELERLAFLISHEDTASTAEDKNTSQFLRTWIIDTKYKINEMINGLIGI